MTSPGSRRPSALRVGGLLLLGLGLVAGLIGFATLASGNGANPTAAPPPSSTATTRTGLPGSPDLGRPQPPPPLGPSGAPLPPATVPFGAPPGGSVPGGSVPGAVDGGTGNGAVDGGTAAGPGGVGSSGAGSGGFDPGRAGSDGTGSSGAAGGIVNGGVNGGGNGSGGGSSANGGGSGAAPGGSGSAGSGSGSSGGVAGIAGPGAPGGSGGDGVVRAPVRVYNNSTITGLAARAAAEFRAAGWHVDEVGNYPYGIIPTSTVYYRAGTQEQPAASTLGSQFGLRVSPRFAGVVDASPGLIVIVTNDFQRR